MTIERDEHGRITKGSKLNPQGRNQWTGSRREAELMLDVVAQTIEAGTGQSRLERVIDRVFREAENGEPWACRLLLDRLIPTLSSLHLRPEVSGPSRSSA